MTTQHDIALKHGITTAMNTSHETFQFRYKDQALKEHERLSSLYRENRFQFELERKKVIEKTIHNVKNENRQKNLQNLQKKWDTILKNSGSKHNRFVLIQMLFWDLVNGHFRPALSQFWSEKN